MQKRHWAIAALALVLIAGQQGPAHAGLVTGLASLDTSGLSGPFELAFIFTDGSASGDANNNVTLSNFLLGGGAPGTVDTTLSTGGESGDLGSSVSLVDSSFFNVFASTFTPGSKLTFDFSLTMNIDAGGTPDQLSMVLLQTGGTPVGTQDPSGADSLLTVNIDSASLRFNTFVGDLTPAPIVTTFGTAPEPPILLLLALGLTTALWATGRRTRRS